MHILMLSDAEAEGGAAIAACRLAQGLLEAGQKVTRVVSISDGNEYPWNTLRLTMPYPLPFFRRVKRRLLPTGKRKRWQERLIQDNLGSLLKSLAPDVINVHNMHKATNENWSAELVRICADHGPTVWTLHDMWSFTGRCAYSYDCRKFLVGCDATCPTPEEHPRLAPEQIAPAWTGRRRLLSSTQNLVAVAPSRWLAREAKEGLWSGRRVEIIPYGLPLDNYYPVDRPLARLALGINTPGPVLLIAAEILTERRKGVAILKGALASLSRRPLTVVTLGKGHQELRAEGIYVHELGYVDHERTKVLVYSAADLFIHPAPVDNLPNVVMESLACGTPVVGFNIGGLPDMVRPGKTGWLSDSVSSSALAITLERALDDLAQGKDLRDSCRDLAEAEYGSALQAERYLSLFRSLLADH